MDVTSRGGLCAAALAAKRASSLALPEATYIRRRLWAVEPWRVKHEDDGVCFDDGVSRVVGRDEWHESRIPRGMWP